MKKLLPLLSVLFLISVGLSQSRVNVKTMTIKKYKFIDEKFGEYNFDEEPYLIQKDTYDVKGNLTERLYTNSDGQIIDSLKSYKYQSFGKSTYKYDENNNLIISNDIKSDGTIKRKEKYSYNSKNQVLSVLIEVLGGDNVFRHDYTYNEFDSLKTVDYFTEPSTLVGKEILKYNSSKNVVEEIFYDENGSIDTKHKYEYNNDDRLVKKVGYDSEGLLSNVYIHDYDSLGRKIKLSSSWVFQSKLTPPNGYYYKYDNNGNMIEQTDFDEDPVFERLGLAKKIMTFNSENREIERLIGELTNKFGGDTFKPSEKYIYEYKFY
jgi:hypothetical protein